jgi:hypothetical protein
VGLFTNILKNAESRRQVYLGHVPKMFRVPMWYSLLTHTFSHCISSQRASVASYG